jgi:hypothetical protein
MHSMGPNALSFSPLSQAQGASVGRLPAAPGAAEKFHMLMFSPQAANTAGATTSTAALSGGGLQHHIEGLSRRWEAGQSALQRMTDGGEFTSKELMQTQVTMINCALDVEVSSRCASMFENGVQTLIQRGG